MIAPCGGRAFGLLGPVLVAPLWFAVVPWGSPLACSPQPWAETRWRRVRLSWLVAAMGAPPGPRGGRSPTNRRLFRQPVQYMKNDRRTNRQQKLRSSYPAAPISQGAVCCFSVFPYQIIYLYRAVQGTSFADGCIRVQRSNLQVPVEAKYLTVKK